MEADIARGDKNTVVEDLKRLVQQFCEERNWDPFHTPKDLAIGLVTEASELLEIFRFASASNEKELLETKEGRERIGDELADSLYFILRFAQLYEFDLALALRDKMLKNQLKYPSDLRITQK